jgi:formylglycine-generating enzyme required for sulfatase activity
MQLCGIRESFPACKNKPMSHAKSALFPTVFPATWACEWGQDRAGLFMDINIHGVQQRFRWIEPGAFLMGSPDSELERLDRESLHEVTITSGYWLADTACTQALWMALMKGNRSKFKDNNPVETISWEEVQQFIDKLNTKYRGLEARLPSEAEWEYACRAGTNTAFSFGNNITPEQVNYYGNHPYAGGKKGLYRECTVEVKSLPANPWGLYEMHGNVWEWCEDWFGDYPSHTVVDSIGPDEGVGRVRRGGSWYYNGGDARSAYCSGLQPSDRYLSTGFRLALGRASLSS